MIMPKTVAGKTSIAAPAVLAMVVCGLFVPTPAFAAPSCPMANLNCRGWQHLGYYSYDDCMYWETMIECPEGNAKDDGTDMVLTSREQ
jgi:hypothetical protein